MDSKLLFPAAIFLVLCLVESGSSIKCHQCNSYGDFHCADPFYYPDDETKQPKTEEFLKDCPDDGNDYFCRKIYQNVRGDVRIIRGCGYIKEEREEQRECYTTVLEEYNTEVCSCYEDGCNSASMFQVSAAVMSAVGLAYLLH